MENVKDIRPLKAKMRKKAKERRGSLTKEQKSRMDNKIKNRLLNLWSIRDSSAVLLYVSSPIEVSTLELIEDLLKQGKSVAVPRCEGGEGEMNFYYISSLDDLEKGSYGIYEPKQTNLNKVDLLNSENMTCVVPGLLFDKRGYRLGYGKGYYDRFLSKFKGSTMGVCYGSDLKDKIVHGKYDRTVSLVVTEKEICSVNNGD